MLRSHGRPAKMDTYCWAKRAIQTPKRKSTGGALHYGPYCRSSSFGIKSCLLVAHRLTGVRTRTSVVTASTAPFV
jgi:hypothetical protein